MWDQLQKDFDIDEAIIKSTKLKLEEAKVTKSIFMNTLYVITPMVLLMTRNYFHW